MATDITTDRTSSKPSRLRVHVVEPAKGAKGSVNVTVPIGLVRFGLSMAKRFSPELKDVPLDWDEIAAAIDSGERGLIVHVDDEAEGRTVDVYVE